MGAGSTPMPNAIFTELATWEMIPFVYTPQNRRMVREFERLAERPEMLRRLSTVLRDELGHEIAFAVEAGKIAANKGTGPARIDLNPIEPDLFAALSPDDLVASLERFGDALKAGARETCTSAGLAPYRVSRVIYVGGSSLMSLVPNAMKALFPSARHSFSEVFTAVTDGLAIAAGRRDGL